MGAVKALSPRKRVFAALAAIVASGAVARVCAALFDRPLMPDEFFQYLEPAWWHLTGAGIETWEWHVGLRSWVLPFFNGAWMALWMGLGIQHAPTLAALTRVCWALINTSLILVAWRGGSSLTRKLNREVDQADPLAPPPGWQGGLIAAALCAGFGLLVLYSGHTLSELPSLLCLVGGLVLISELTERPREDVSPVVLHKAAWSGVLLSLGACLRIANGPLTLLPALWLLCARRFRALLALVLAALLPALAFGLADLLTWGAFAGSFVKYVQFNVVQGGASHFGTQAGSWYAQRLWQTLPLGLPLLGLTAAAGLRATWPHLASAATLVAYLSREPHKEGRFILLFWPLLLIAAAGALGAWIARTRARGVPPPQTSWADRARELGPWLASLAIVMLVLIDGTREVRLDYWIDPARVRAHAWLGRQPELTGALIDAPIYTTASFGFNSRAPQMHFQAALLENPLISHVVAGAGSLEEYLSRVAGFEIVHREGAFVVLSRRAQP